MDAYNMPDCPTQVRGMDGNIALMLAIIFLSLSTATYLVTLKYVRATQHCRTSSLDSQHTNKAEKPFTDVSIIAAHEVLTHLATIEFPTAFIAAIQLGIFRSYGIPSISTVLLQSGHFDRLEDTTLRTANTAALLTEMFYPEPGHARSIKAVKRTNSLHRALRSKDIVRNKDMLFTLSSMAMSVVYMIDGYEWRGLANQERDALGEYWKYLADQLHITYTGEMPLASWNCGFEWLDRLFDWCKLYEAESRGFAQSNNVLATRTLASQQWCVKFLTVAMLDADDRSAMVLGCPPTFAILVRQVPRLRRLIERHVWLPRMRRVSWMGVETSESGYFWGHRWSVHPWYMKPVAATETWPLTKGLSARTREEQANWQAHGYDPDHIGGSRRSLELLKDRRCASGVARYSARC